MAEAALRLVNNDNTDRSKALDAALSQIERAFGKGSIMRLGKNDKSMDIGTVSTGSLGLDIALGIGGLPRGRVIEIYGPESSGKTTLALHAVAEIQKKGGVAAYVDAEKGVTDGAAALEGARWILIETFAEDAELIGGLRELLATVHYEAVRAGLDSDGGELADLDEKVRTGNALANVPAAKQATSVIPIVFALAADRAGSH